MKYEGAPKKSYNPFTWIRNKIEEWKENRPEDLNRVAFKGPRKED